MAAATYSGPDTDLQPDAGAAAAFLSYWFEHCNKGEIEIGHLDQGGRGLIHFQRFPLGNYQEAVAYAIQANLVPGQACYVRASTVRPRLDGFTTDADFVQAPGIWGDIDTKEQFDHARAVQSIVRPTASVITGTVPHMRVQNWFRASEPIVNGQLVRDLNVRLHRLYGGDPAVVNPTRLMRLPGTIAWPWKEGRTPEVTRFIRPDATDARPASYPLSTLTSQLPDDVPAPQRPPAPPRIGGLSTVSSLLESIRTGVEWHNNTVRLTAHLVGAGRPSSEILAMAEGITLPGYTADQTRTDMRKMIDAARAKWGVPDIEPVVSGEPDTPFGPDIIDPWDTLQPPAFPVHILPDILRAYVESRARIMGADPCALAWVALSACSAALDGRTRLRLKKHDTWSVPPALWVALIGPSSSKKSPIIQDAWRSLETTQARALSAYAKASATYENLTKEEKAATKPPLKPRRLITHDATMESLQGILSYQDRGIGIIRDELAGFIGAMDKYSGNGRGGAADRAFFLQSYNGGEHVVDRVGRGTVAINNLLTTICGGIQPDRLAQFNDLADDGLWQRFIPIVVGPGGLGADEPAGQAAENFQLRLESLIDASQGDTVRLSDGAHVVRAQLEREIFALEQSDPLGAQFSSFVGKMPGLFGRLALVLNFVEPSGLGFIVPERIAVMARRLILECVIPHAAQVYMTMGGKASQAEAMQGIAGYVLVKKLGRVLVSDLTSNVRACRNKPLNEVHQMVSPLVSGGWLLPETPGPGNRSWVINPIVHTKFANRSVSEGVRRAHARAILRGEPEE